MTDKTSASLRDVNSWSFEFLARCGQPSHTSRPLKLICFNPVKHLTLQQLKIKIELP